MGPREEIAVVQVVALVNGIVDPRTRDETTPRSNQVRPRSITGTKGHSAWVVDAVGPAVTEHIRCSNCAHSLTKASWVQRNAVVIVASPRHQKVSGIEGVQTRRGKS